MKPKEAKALTSFLVYLREYQYIAPDDTRTDSDILDSYDMYRAYHPDVPAVQVDVTAAQINQQADNNVSAVRLENLETRVDVWGQRISELTSNVQENNRLIATLAGEIETLISRRVAQLAADVQEIQKQLPRFASDARSNAPWPPTHSWLVPVDFTEQEEAN